MNLSKRAAQTLLIYGAACIILFLFIPIPGIAKFFMFFISAFVMLVVTGILPWGLEQRHRLEKQLRVALAVLFIIFVVLLGFAFMGNFQPAYFAVVLALGALLGTAYHYAKRGLFAEMDREDAEEEKRQSEDYGQSVFTPYEEFKALNEEPGKNGQYIGYDILRTFHCHTTTIAPQGAGKGTTLIIPNLLKVPHGSIVVTDPKGELAHITARAQKEYGQRVYILDPWAWQEKTKATHGIPSCGFNPFDMLRHDYNSLPDNCEMIARHLIPERQSKDAFWDNRARSFIKNMLLYMVTSLPTEEQNFWTLYKLVRTPPSELASLLVPMKESVAFDGLIAAAASELESLILATETYGGIMSHVHEGTAIFESPQLRRSLLKSDFNPYDLANGDVTLYIVIPEKYIKSHSAYLKIVMGLCMKAVNEKPNKRVSLIIDEAGLIGKFDEISDAYTIGRGQNIWLWTIWQNIGQIERLYGKPELQHFIGSSNIFQAFGISDFETATYISNGLGKTTRRKKRQPTNPNDQPTWESYEYPLVSPDQVMAEPGMFVFGDQGKKTLLARVPYFNMPPDISGKADPPPRLND